MYWVPTDDARGSHWTRFSCIQKTHISTRNCASLQRAFGGFGFWRLFSRGDRWLVKANQGIISTTRVFCRGSTDKTPAIYSGAFMIAKITLTVAIVLGVAITAASAATKHRRPAQANPQIYNAAASRGAVGGISLSTACGPSQSPCRTQPDSW